MTDKIYKQYIVESKAIDLDAGVFEAMITTEDVDRAGDIVRATGAKLENYLKNPVVPFAHNYSVPPVAKALGITIIPGRGLTARFQFPQWGVSEQADTVRQLWAGGFLNATSIGFIPLESINLNGEREWWGPQDYVSWELLEFSIVTVPANADALRLAVKTLMTQKSGRVLSAANEKRLRQALELLQQVLDQLEELEEDDEKGLPGAQAPVTEPQPEATNNDDSNGDAGDLVEALTNYFNNLTEVL